MTTPAHKARLVLALRSAGITDTKVLSAIERVPRELFVPDTFKDRAYDDTALPIGYGQTLSQPLVVATMRSEEHTSELQSLMRISYAVFCLKKKKTTNTINSNQLLIE